MKDPRNHDYWWKGEPLSPWSYELWTAHGDRDLVCQYNPFSEKNAIARALTPPLPQTSVKGIHLVCVLLCTSFHWEGNQKHLRSLGLSKFVWLPLQAVLIPLLLDMHLLHLYCCPHSILTTSRREEASVSQCRGFISHGQESVVQQSSCHVRLGSWERGMSVFSIFSPFPFVPANGKVLPTFMAHLLYRHIWVGSWINPLGISSYNHIDNQT